MPIPFPPTVPIIGQPPFTIVAHYPTVLLQCQCPAKSPLLLVGAGATGSCPACANTYGIGEVGPVKVGQVVPK